MSELTQRIERRRVLSGMRPTGKLHLGNYMGALYNWVRLQDEYECYFFIADLHALTTNYEDLSLLKADIRDVALDFLGGGLDPVKATIFVQSDVLLHDRLNTLLGMFTPLSWLERVPTYKDQQEQLREKDLATYGFLGYPLLQSADILLYQPHYVPVGLDQASHVELTREVARRFNQLYPGEFFMGEGAAPWELEAVKMKAKKLSGKADKSFFTPHELIAAAPQTKLKSAYGTRTISARAGGAADPFAEAAGNGRAEDVQELREYDSDVGQRSGGAREAEDDGDGSGTGAARGSGESGGLSGVRSA